MLARALMIMSAAIPLVLGIIHLAYTLVGRQLTPRPPLQIAMSQVPLMLTRQTTMWRAWIGFNASHSMGAILFGLVYGYLAFGHAELVFQSVFLQSWDSRCWRASSFLRSYWFGVPFRATCGALACHVAGVAVSRLEPLASCLLSQGDFIGRYA
jgi:hypothetical protein